LKRRCSIKWEIPFSEPCSSLDPANTQIPIETELRYGILSVITFTPFGRVVFSYPDPEAVQDGSHATFDPFDPFDFFVLPFMNL
jgi:hypothetical protein